MLIFKGGLLLDRINEQFHRLNRLYREYDGIYHNIAVHFGVSDSVLWIFYSLFEMDKPCTPKEISELCLFPKQTIHSALKSLEEKGFITLTVSEKSRKNRIITLTEKGNRFVKEFIYPIVDAEKAALNELSDEERANMLDLFFRYQKFLKEKIEEMSNNLKKQI